MLVKQCSRLLRLRLTVPLARSVSDNAKDGAVKDEGGSFGKKGEADENAYFYKLAQEQLGKLKKEDNSEDNKDKTAGKQREGEKEKSKK